MVKEVAGQNQYLGLQSEAYFDLQNPQKYKPPMQTIVTINPSDGSMKEIVSMG